MAWTAGAVVLDAIGFITVDALGFIPLVGLLLAYAVLVLVAVISDAMARPVGTRSSTDTGI